MEQAERTAFAEAFTDTLASILNTPRNVPLSDFSPRSYYSLSGYWQTKVFSNSSNQDNRFNALRKNTTNGDFSTKMSLLLQYPIVVVSTVKKNEVPSVYGPPETTDWGNVVML
jgi:hypothetical protein